MSTGEASQKSLKYKECVLHLPAAKTENTFFTRLSLPVNLFTAFLLSVWMAKTLVTEILYSAWLGHLITIHICVTGINMNKNRCLFSGP